MLAYYQMRLKEQMWLVFETKYKNFLRRKSIQNVVCDMAVISLKLLSLKEWECSLKQIKRIFAFPLIEIYESPLIGVNQSDSGRVFLTVNGKHKGYTNGDLLQC